MISNKFRIVSLIGTSFLVLTVFRGNTQAADLQAIASRTTERVSVASDGSEGNGDSGGNAISSNGRYVAFSSYASNLVSGDTNGKRDVFIHDRQTGLTERVSVASDGSQGNGDSLWEVISDYGRFVAFESYATNLVIGDTNGRSDIFVHDRQTGLTERVSVASDGSQENGDAEQLAISSNGRFVTFISWSSNLVSGKTTGVYDVFVHDRQTGQTERVSVASDGSEANDNSYGLVISADGRYVAFYSNASNLVSGGTNGAADVFLHDRQTGLTERISIASDGSQGNNYSDSPTFSADVRYVAFSSFANNLVSGDTNRKEDIFVHDRQTGLTKRVVVAFDGSQGDGDSYWPVISADGRYVVFASDATNLGTWDSNGIIDIFVYDRLTGLTERISVSSDGKESNNISARPAFSADGCYVVFESLANNLVSSDYNIAWDVFIHSWRQPQLLYIPMIPRD